MLYLPALTPGQHVALSGSDYWYGNKKHMLKITVQFPESVWTLTASRNVFTSVCISFFRSLRTLITRSLVYFRANQTLNYQWDLNHLYHIEFWNFQIKKLYEGHKCTTEGWAFFFCLMWNVLHGWVSQIPEILFSPLRRSLWGSYGSNITACVMVFHGFVLQISKEAKKNKPSISLEYGR